jgi:hypothetical protein
MRLLLCCVAVAATSACGPSKEERQRQLAAQQAQRKAQQLSLLKQSAISAVTKQLLDPNSAQFTEVVVNTKDRTVCGKVNAKNTFGGYTGSKVFAFKEGSEAKIQGDAPITLIYEPILGFCGNYPAVKEMKVRWEMLTGEPWPPR